MNARVSILLPTYEPSERYLAIAISCVQAQTFTDWELIIHDDASDIDVKTMIEPHLSDQRIRFIRSSRRLGIGGNWNACLQYTKAPFIQFLFQDDMWEPAYLEKMTQILEADTSLGFAACAHTYLNDDGIAVANYDYVQKERGAMLAGKNKGRMFLYDWIMRGLHPNLIGEPPFVMLRKSLTEKVGPFATDLPQGLDSDYWARCLVHTDFWWVAENLGTFRVHDGGASAMNDRTGRGLFDRLLILGRLTKLLPPDEARRTRDVLHTQFRFMTRKFTSRLKADPTAKSKRGGSLKALMDFACRHPLFLIRTAIGALGKSLERR